MMKTLGFGAGALVAPAMMAGALLVTATPEAEGAYRRQAPMSGVGNDRTGMTVDNQGMVAGATGATRDYGVTWKQLYVPPNDDIAVQDQGNGVAMNTGDYEASEATGP